LGPSFDALATCISSEELAVIVNVPQQELPGLPMYERSHFALSVPPATPQSISLGILQDSLGRNLNSVFITAEELNRHCFVTGITGYGKTNTCMHILLEAYEKLGVPFLVVEPAKTEYQRLTQIPRLREELRVYSLGGDSALPFRLNPLQPVPGIPLGRHIDLLKAVFNASFPIFAGMPYVLEEAILDVYTEYGWSFYTSQNASLCPYASLSERSALLPNLQDLHDRIEIVLAKKKYGQEIHQNMGAALRARLQSLMKGNKGLTLNTRRSVPLEDLFAKPTVIELQNLGDDEEKAFLMALLFTLLYEYAETRQASFSIEQRGCLQHLTLIEEAHRLLRATSGHINPEIGDPRAKAVMMFTDMLAEMRAYGEGFIIADQIPTKLAPETLKNSNLKIVHRLAAPDDRQVTGDCMNLTESQMRHLNTLSPGMAVVHSERIGEAVLTKIHPTKDTRAPDHLAREERQQREMLKREDRIYLYRHAGCRSCPDPCNFYHWVEEATSRGEEISPPALRAFFENVLFDQVENAWQQWTMWRSARQEYDASPQSQEAQGRLYCIVTQAAYTWLGELLIDRGLVVRKERKLLPGERIIREQVAQAFSELLLIWSMKTQLDAEGRNVFAVTRQYMRRLVVEVPLREQPCCAQCPIRCLALPFVAPYIRPLEKPVATKLAENLSSDTKLEIIRRTIEQQIKILSNHRGNQALYQGMLYCLLTNIQVSPEVSAKRDELLALLR
jgi:DNA helicase HerA-like ATPase